MASTATLPDVELLVCDWLRAALGGTPVGTTLVGWRKGTPHVQVRRTGGSVRYAWVDTAEVSLDIRSASREAAAALAIRVREAMGQMARAFSPPDAVISTVTEGRGPGWLPDPDQQGRYRQEYQIIVHPRPVGGA